MYLIWVRYYTKSELPDSPQLLSSDARYVYKTVRIIVTEERVEKVIVYKLSPGEKYSPADSIGDEGKGGKALALITWEEWQGGPIHEIFYNDDLKQFEGGKTE
jgi:hypothetical protein